MMFAIKNHYIASNVQYVVVVWASE